MPAHIVTTIPTTVRRLIAEHIPSVERLEILLKLFEVRPRAWSVHELEAFLRTTPESIERHLVELAAGGHVIATDSTFAYAPQPERDEVVRKLLQTYRTRRVSVIELIYTRDVAKR